MAALIAARDLGKRFGPRVVLDGLNFDVEHGQRLALLGLNGAGKTTLLRCVMGVLSFDGSIVVDGLNVVTSGKRVRGHIGYVPQRPPLFNMPLSTMVGFFSTLRGIPTGVVADRLEQLGLPLGETGDLALRELSGGMLQKALLAIALAADPPLLLMDEPTANLDPKARGEFMRALKQIAPDTTVLLASHRLDEVETVADRVWILHDGARAFDGTLDELRDRSGADGWLWVRTRNERRDDMRREFLKLASNEAVIANGTHVAVRLPASARTDALLRLRQLDMPIDDFWVASPSLEDVIEGFFTESKR